MARRAIRGGEKPLPQWAADSLNTVSVELRGDPLGGYFLSRPTHLIRPNGDVAITFVVSGLVPGDRVVGYVLSFYSETLGRQKNEGYLVPPLEADEEYKEYEITVDLRVR